MSQKVPLPANEALQKFCSSGFFFKAHELKSSLAAKDTEAAKVRRVVSLKNAEFNFLINYFFQYIGFSIPFDK
jgi:hypothetical protein